MKYIPIALLMLILGMGGYVYVTKQQSRIPPVSVEQATTTTTVSPPAPDAEVTVTPIAHATMVLSWDGLTLYTDPVGEITAFAAAAAPNIILLTDIHPDHLDINTLEALVASSSMVTIIAPDTVVQELPAPLQAKTVTLGNGSTTVAQGFTIQAVPMYNLPEVAESLHTKGRGNGYVIERSGTRVYVAGDTEDTPEMRALKDIDIAFIPMNLPYTMTVEAAADAVLAFAPHVVYPYHYRGKDGLSDITLFASLVTAGNPAIRVELRDWYPVQETASSTATTTSE